MTSVLLAVVCCSLGILLCLVVSGCKESIANKSIPAPLNDVGYEVIGRVHRVMEGDLLEADVSGKLHCISILGVDSPKHGQNCFLESVTSTRDMTRGKDLRIKIVDRDDSMIEMADVMVIDSSGNMERHIDVGLELIRQGLAWYNGDELADSERLIQAQKEAKALGVGLWSQPNPVPPWEFESARQANRNDRRP